MKTHPHSFQIKTPFRPWRPWREISAFSLTEVVIAMGVAAVAFTSLLALFPVGLSASKESYEATQGALIAKSIMNQLTDVQGGTGNTGFRRIICKTNNNPTISANLTNMDTGNYTTVTNVYLVYSNYVASDGSAYWRPSAAVASSNWTAGYPNSVALVRVTLRRVFTGGASYDMHHAEVQVDFPGSSALTNRNHQLFSRIFH